MAEIVFYYKHEYRCKLSEEDYYKIVKYAEITDSLVPFLNSSFKASPIIPFVLLSKNLKLIRISPTMLISIKH